MKEIIYRLRSRKKQIITNTLIVSLVMFASFLTVFLPQLVEPQILGKYFDNYNVSLISLDQYISDVGITRFVNDIEISGSASSVEFLEEYTSILQATSTESFGIFNTTSHDLVCSVGILFNGTDQNTLFGVNRKRYEEILTINQNVTSHDDAIVITSKINDSITTGNYDIQINGDGTYIPVDHILTLNETLNELPYFISFLDKYHSIEQDERVFLMPVDRLMNRYDTIIKTSGSSYYNLEGYILFSEEQQDIVCWSRDAKSNLLNFYETLLFNLRTVEITVNLDFSSDTMEKIDRNSLAIEIIFTFVRGIQILCWSLSFIVLGISINKTQKVKREQELRIMMSGYSNIKRISMHISESFVLTFLSSVICSGILFPIIKFQSVFGISLNIDKNLIVNLTIFVILVFLTIIGVLLEYDLFIRRRIFSSSQNKEYRPLVLLSNSMKIIVILLTGGIFWLINLQYRSEYILLAFAGSLVISILLILILRGIVESISRLLKHIRMKKDTPRKDFWVLYQLWKRNLLSKIFLYVFIFSILMSILLLTNLTADFFKTQSTWVNGSEVSLDVQQQNFTEIEDYLNQNPDVISFTKVIHVAPPTGLFTTFTGSYNGFLGINSTEYIEFYKSWNSKDWITDGSIRDFDNKSLYVSKKLQEYDLELEDTLYFTVGGNVTIKSFINKWPQLTHLDGYGSDLVEFLIIDFAVLEQILIFKNIEYAYRYLVHTTFDETENIAKELDLMGITDEVSYVNIQFHEGAKNVILSILILVSQIFLILWISIFIYSNLDDINSSNKARSLGLLAVAKNYRKAFRNYKLVELMMLILTFIVMTVLLSSAIYLVYFSLFGVKLLVSYQTTRNLLIILGMYLGFLTIQSTVEIFKYNKLELSLLNRHPE